MTAVPRVSSNATNQLAKLKTEMLEMVEQMLDDPGFAHVDFEGLVATICAFDSVNKAKGAHNMLCRGMLLQRRRARAQRRS